MLCAGHIVHLHPPPYSFINDGSSFPPKFQIFKARYVYLCGSAFYLIGIGMPEKALGWFPLGFVERQGF